MKHTYGIPLFLMKKYLTDLGAVETKENVMVGDGWQAIVNKGEPAKIGALVIGRIDVKFSGNKATLEKLLEKLHWKTMRGGG